MPQPAAKSPIIMQVQPQSPISEAYRSLRFNLEYSASDREVQTIAVTSAYPGEGKTTTALNLAAAYAQAGKKVALLDADLRKPSVHLAFGGKNSVGLSNFLVEPCEAFTIIHESSIDNLHVITSGPIPPNPAELLTSDSMDALLDKLKRNYDRVIVDCPPILPLTDAKILAAKCDGVLLVVEYGKVKRTVARKINEELSLSKANLMGIVCNKIKKKHTEAYLYQ